MRTTVDDEDGGAQDRSEAFCDRAAGKARTDDEVVIQSSTASVVRIALEIPVEYKPKT